jgi:hypothetical protein
MVSQRSDNGAQVRHGAQGCFIRPQAQRCAWFGSLIALLPHDESPRFERWVLPVIRSGRGPLPAPHSSWDRQGGQEIAHNCRDEARATLAAVYGTVTEDFTTPDLVDTAAQLNGRT